MILATWNIRINRIFDSFVKNIIANTVSFRIKEFHGKFRFKWEKYFICILISNWMILQSVQIVNQENIHQSTSLRYSRSALSFTSQCKWEDLYLYSLKDQHAVDRWKRIYLMNSYNRYLTLATRVHKFIFPDNA